MSQVQGVYSTHDWTAGVVTPEPLEQYRETWADVKTPGDDRQYSVGTIQVRTTLNASFSGEPAEPVADPSGFPGTFTLPQGQTRQVVIVQCTDATPKAAGPATFQRILWQRYFYGVEALGETTDRAANARGIAVWPTDAPVNTRIAICGETYDQRLPGSTDTFSAATAQAPTGFIAVLDGTGALLWTHHMFGADPAQSCAITDISIRVEPDGREVVTYCGLSSHGDPGPGTPLTRVLPATGSTPSLPGQWVGIVGRVSRPSGGAPAVEFHSDVWLGSLQEGFFGLAEIEVDYATQPPLSRFAVVGASEVGGAGGLIGTAFTFDATPTRATPTGQLGVEGLQFLGGGEETQTIARDVLLLADGFATGAGTEHLLAIVGSTTDATLFAPFATPLPMAPALPLAGATDGFLMLATAPSTGLVLQGGAFFGGPGDDGFTGVQGWNEYPDQIIAAGFTAGPTGGGNPDIAVVSYYLDSSVAGVSPSSVRVVRQEQIGGAVPVLGSAAERPAGMGTVNATTVGLPFPTFGLDDPAGGGVAVDQRARVNVVGYTDASDYPASFPGSPGRPRDAAPPSDAVRTVFDMLPPARTTPAQTFGVGRTDLSGDQGAFVLPAGLTGGTTPACALSPFGRRIGDPPPILSRMLIDYEGDAPAANLVSNGALLLSRPSSLVFTAWQWDIPGVGGTPPAALLLAPPLFNGVELFVPQALVLGGPIIGVGVGVPGHSIRVPVNFTVPTPVTFSSMVVQVICWFPGNPQPGGLTCTATDTTEMTGSAGMWLPL